MRKTIAFVLALAVILLAAPAARAESGALDVKAFGGWGFFVGGDPLEGRDGYSAPASSSLDDSWTLGGELTYRLPFGLSLGLGSQYLKSDLSASRGGGPESDWAELKMVPVYALAKYDHSIAGPFSIYAEGGLGYSFNDADKGQAMKTMEAGLGRAVDYDTDNSFLFLVGTGAKYDLASDWSLDLGFRYWWSKMDTELRAGDLGTLSKETIDAQNIQILLGVSYRFRF